MWRWHIFIVVCTMVGVALAEDRWVWGTSNPESKSRKIPGFVATTPEPPITTFRPSLPASVGRSVFTPSLYHNRLPNHPAFFPGGFFPFDFVPSDVPRTNDDGTIKSRVTLDTATLDSSSGATLTAHDKYTTLDRLQRERGPAPTFPPPQRHQLGGLHPDEVFYADDDLLIIRGGGFNSDIFQEPSQPLDSDEEDIDESSRIISSVSPPSTDQEYNGNIPVILPPPKDTEGSIPVVLPHQMKPSPFSLFVGGSSTKDYILVPFVETQSSETNKLDSVIEPITHNHLGANETQASSKLRRAASSIIPYVYPAPKNTYVLHQAHRQPAFQYQRVVQTRPAAEHQSMVQQSHIQPLVHHQRIVQIPVIVQHQPLVQHQQALHNQRTMHRGQLIYYQPVIQQQPPVVASHYTVPGYPVVQSDPVVHPMTPDPQYAELELQPEPPQVFIPLTGDTDVNFLHPLPTRNPDAEILQPQFRKPTVVHTDRRTQRPRV